MSRIGKRALDIPEGVKINSIGHELKVEGPKGSLEWILPASIKIRLDENKKKLFVESDNLTKQEKALHGLSRNLIRNMVIGVTKGYEKRLEIHGVGYNGKLDGKTLVINVGFTHPVKIPIPEGLVLTLPNPNMVVVQGLSKELVGQFSATIRFVKPCEPYNLKGIKYIDEVIRRKAGKTFVSGS